MNKQQTIRVKTIIASQRVGAKRRAMLRRFAARNDQRARPWLTG
jgi:hypothetical protein